MVIIVWITTLAGAVRVTCFCGRCHVASVRRGSDPLLFATGLRTTGRARHQTHGARAVQCPGVPSSQSCTTGAVGAPLCARRGTHMGISGGTSDLGAWKHTVGCMRQHQSRVRALKQQRPPPLRVSQHWDRASAQPPRHATVHRSHGDTQEGRRRCCGTHGAEGWPGVHGVDGCGRCSSEHMHMRKPTYAVVATATVRLLRLRLRLRHALLLLQALVS